MLPHHNVLLKASIPAHLDIEKKDIPLPPSNQVDGYSLRKCHFTNYALFLDWNISEEESFEMEE